MSKKQRILIIGCLCCAVLLIISILLTMYFGDDLSILSTEENFIKDLLWQYHKELNDLPHDLIIFAEKGTIGSTPTPWAPRDIIEDNRSRYERVDSNTYLMDGEKIKLTPQPKPETQPRK